jgi:hypothetical protein
VNSGVPEGYASQPLCDDIPVFFVDSLCSRCVL